MKKIILSAAFLGLGVLSFGQQKMDIGSNSSMRSNVDFAQMKENRLQKIKSEYNLTDAQFAKVRELYDKRDIEQKKLADYQAKERERIAKENMEGMKTILTPEQYLLFLEKNNRKTLNLPVNNEKNKDTNSFAGEKK